LSHGQQNNVRLKDVSVHQHIASSKENTTQTYKPAAAAVYHPVAPSQWGTQLLDDSQNNTSSMLIGQDLWKQLKRVTIPAYVLSTAGTFQDEQQACIVKLHLTEDTNW